MKEKKYYMDTTCASCLDLLFQSSEAATDRFSFPGTSVPPEWVPNSPQKDPNTPIADSAE
jgi:hypothetical protein